MSAILTLIHQHSLHLRPSMMDNIPEGVRQEYIHWFGEEMLDDYHLEFDTLLWVPWLNGGCIMMVSEQRYELYSFQDAGDKWLYVGPREADTVAAIRLSVGKVSNTLVPQGGS